MTEYALIVPHVRSFEAPSHALAASALVSPGDYDQWKAVEQQMVHPADLPNQALLARACYVLYCALGRLLSPSSILEVGVRYGYSLVGLSVGSNLTEEVFGIDSEAECCNSNEGAQLVLSRFGVKSKLLTIDAQEADVPILTGRNWFKLVHLDLGNETLTSAECFAIIEKYSRFGKKLLVASAFCPPVWASIRTFISRCPTPVSISFYATPMGLALLQL